MGIALKYALETVLTLFVRLFHLFPLREKQVFFSSFSGRQYSDSPRRISEYLGEKHPEIQQVWAFNEPEKFAFLKDRGITVVKYKSLKHLYYALSSKVYVDNVEYWSLLRFRKTQMVVETWHGSGAYKRIGGDRIDIGSAGQKHAVDKMNRTTLFLSGCTAFTDFVIRGAYRYEGEILEAGLPRNDELFCPNKDVQQRLREKIGLEDGVRVVMYAPTFRNSKDVALYDVDFSRLRAALSTRFGGEWAVLLRMHYYMTDLWNGKDNFVFNVSDYPDMQELLQISDVLVTDYSSTIWDFSLIFRPCFLYATDVDAYCGERNFYTPISSWPFPLAQNNDALEEAILTFDEERYRQDVEAHHRDLGNRESGEATARTCEKIITYIGGKQS